MFGIAVARLDQITEAEKERYQALYCGLCFSLRDRYGHISRASLSYDLAFLVMLYDSLYEPSEERGSSHCIAHPKRKVPFAISVHSARAADLSVALAYHKCLDDAADDGSLKAKTASTLLRNSYRRAQDRIPGECRIIEDLLLRGRMLEDAPDTGPDDVARNFGALLGSLFGMDQGAWAEALTAFGESLGVFIYMMDAAVDYEDDLRTGSYNPFLEMFDRGKPDVVMMRSILETLAGEMTSTFERLPLVQDVHLMRSVLYSGVWQRFNMTYRGEGEDATCRP